MRKSDTRKFQSSVPNEPTKSAQAALDKEEAAVARNQQALSALDPPKSMSIDVNDFAREMLATKRGISMTPPFYAETASNKNNQSWPYWIVRNAYCNSLARFFPKEDAERVAAAMNQVSAMKTAEEDVNVSEDPEAYYALPEDALQFLPEEWRDHFQAMADNGRVILKSVDNELTQLVRVLNSFTAVMTLKHVQKRLTGYKFELNMDALLELEMLTTAFVVIYVRLHQGGTGSGFSRDSIPEKLRGIHDVVLGLRNKRFAHNDAHDSVSDALELFFEDSRFEVKFGISLGYSIGGAKEWPDLVNSVEAIYSGRIDKLLERLKHKTGYEWALQSGPAPEENE
ncbi:hypothetical protein QY049_02775 [Bradyrhizobium sp. WYCCWR 13022]|uniref:hypothetical protein n=1 Tax=unclassified Bradyrhizobium TaxID=2631580 RepID=UPI00263BA7C0|nr:hypothetical protein [Bradyrhizobium sp. WYCCWR 13022]MDN4982148.1 hypothetical protein [Bradyrhizobium sp. WYCCWR 13022]